MIVRDMIKLLEADGWRFERQKGSHKQYRHPKKPADCYRIRTSYDGRDTKRNREKHKKTGWFEISLIIG
jgi:hypothetical protein